MTAEKRHKDTNNAGAKRPSVVSKILHWGDERLRVFFPYKQFVYRTQGRVKCLNLTPRIQGGMAGVVMIIGGWVAFTSGSMMLHEMELAAKDAQIADVRVAYRSLMSEVADYQKRFSGVVHNLEQNHAMMLELAGQNNKLQKDLKTLTKSRKARAEIESSRAAMTARLGDVESQMQSLAQRNFSLKDDMTTIESDLQDALSQRNTALMESTQMRRDIRVLENKLVNLEEKENTTVERLTDQAEVFITNLEQLIEMAGLDVEDLMAGDDDLVAGQGGPFIELQGDGRPAGRLKSKLQNLENRLAYSDSLQTVVKKIPFAVPLQGYYLTSKFGKRRDPKNRKWSMHYGVDFGSSPRAAVSVTAPGKVTYAGWKGSFGKLVEVDHGAGIKTRYGHLSKINVKKGQTVSFGDKIGVIGNTGRSTGKHLHYEVLFRDKGIDPMKFIKAGRYVFKE
ncbi:MAG: peptidoglycan DD-metalloendopeptidase family protein [Magnetovibrio sp.]|nr:peptidoglycan DD-metalloendopeptidase family protein [Magnetovibrio sp.]